MKALRLILPALFPSWRFFPEVGPSPRIEYRVLARPDGQPSAWIAFGGRPDALSLTQSLKSLFWNPAGNASLFLVTCCEQFLAHQSQAALDHLTRHICAEAIREHKTTNQNYFEFRLLVVYREDNQLKYEDVYRSTVMPLNQGAPDDI